MIGQGSMVLGSEGRRAPHRPSLAARAGRLLLSVAFGALLALPSLPRPALADWDVETASFLVLVNEYRAQNGLGPLTMDAKLQRAADWHANDQYVTADCTNKTPFTCGHTDSRGRDLGKRLSEQFGVSRGGFGENVVWDAVLGNEALESWKQSPGHNANMLGKDWTVTGIGRSCSANGCLYVQVFGSQANEPFAAPPIPGVPANFTGDWALQFDSGSIFVVPMTLTQAGDQVNGTLAVSLTTQEPVSGDNRTRLQGRRVPGTPKVIGTFTQPANGGDPEIKGSFELTMGSGGALKGAWRSDGRFWIMKESPRAAANAAPPAAATPKPANPAPPAVTAPATTAQPPASTAPAPTEPAPDEDWGPVTEEEQ